MRSAVHRALAAGRRTIRYAGVVNAIREPATSQVASPSGLRDAPLLPPELPWLYLVIPLPAAYLLGHNLLDQPMPLVALVLKAYVPFLAFGGAFHVLYRTVMPRLLARASSSMARALLHVTALLVVVPVVSLPLIPLLSWWLERDINCPSTIIVSYIFSAACLFPSLAIQRFRIRANQAEHQALLERKAALEAQLYALQARTDPHFLFNSINTVASLIPENPELAERTLERLADLFRYALESGRAKTVTLERELAMTSDYLALQSARFGARLDARLEVEEGLDGVELPPLLLQPLVENAILHGLSNRSTGKVRIDIRRDNDRLLVDVVDDGPGIGQSSHSGSRTGVSGVKERLQLHYGARASLSLESLPGAGSVARMILPIVSPV